MDFQDRFVRVLCNVIPVLQVASGQLSELMSEEVKVGKAMRVAELSPVVKFELGPFESVDDHFYTDDHYVRAVNLKNLKVRERLTGVGERKRPERKKTDSREIPLWENHRQNSRTGKQKHRSFGPQAKRKPWGNARTFPSEFGGVVEQMNAIKNEVKKFKTMSRLLTNLKAQVHEMERALTIEPLEKLLAILEESFYTDRNKMTPTDGNTFNGINNITYNNQYQIENVFTINRLSRPKETDAGIMEELSEHDLDEVLDKAVAHLQGDSSSGPELLLKENEKDLLNQLQRNFSRIFSHQNVSLEQMNQMSKIIDFVERYHGSVGSLKSSSPLRGQNAKGGHGRRMEPGVRNAGFGLSDGEGGEEEKGRGKRGGKLLRRLPYLPAESFWETPDWGS